MKKGADALCLDMALEKGYLGSDLSVSAELTDFHRNYIFGYAIFGLALILQRRNDRRTTEDEMFQQ